MIMDYDPDHFEERTVSTIPECLPFKTTDTVTWIHINGLSSVNLVEELGKAFGIHPLILEDILSTDQRPKMDDLDTYLYLGLKVLKVTEKPFSVTISSCSLIIGDNYLLSLQEGGPDLFGPVRERVRKDGKIRRFRPDYLGNALIDVIVDQYFVAMEALGEYIEDLEGNLVESVGPATLNEINRVKKEMIFVRKSVWPLREVVLAFERSESQLVREATRIFIRDVYDHIIQVIDTLEVYRDMSSNMLDIYLSSQSFRLNEVMKVLTIIATIFIPLTFVAGLYGMNFEYMPELRHPLGYYFSLLLMLAIALSMLAYFHRKQWI
jgi:magnesium transporter